MVAVATTASVALASVALAGSATAAPRSASATSTRVVAADYFGTADPENFWSSDLSGAAATFRQMKADGFNAVGLVVPWGDFEPSLNPPTFNATDFQNLQHLVALAASIHLGVVLRLSYASDLDPSDQLAGSLRFTEVFGNGAVYNDWLGYISQLHAALAPYSNVEVAYLSWEDFWSAVNAAVGSTKLGQRRTVAHTLGYTRWLSGHVALPRVDAVYRTRFSSYNQVPTPLRSQIAFRLFFRFYDAMLTQRFFLPAQQRYPGLTLEARNDIDPIFNNGRYIGGYVHSTTFRLPGTDLTGVDYHTDMLDPSTAVHETAAQAYTGLKNILSFVSGRSGGRRLFVSEFLFVDNAPSLGNVPHLTPGQVRPFLNLANGPLRRYTDGYVVWTYRDYRASLVYNPSFSLGLAGWRSSGRVRVEQPSGVRLGPSSSVSQAVPFDAWLPGPGAPLTVSFEAKPISASAQMTLRAGRLHKRTFRLAPGWRTYTTSYRPGIFKQRGLEFSTGGAAQLRNVEAYWFTQSGDVYGPTGAPRLALSSLERLNRRVARSG